MAGDPPHRHHNFSLHVFHSLTTWTLLTSDLGKTSCSTNPIPALPVPPSRECWLVPAPETRRLFDWGYVTKELFFKPYRPCPSGKTKSLMEGNDLHVEKQEPIIEEQDHDVPSTDFNLLDSQGQHIENFEDFNNIAN